LDICHPAWLVLLPTAACSVGCRALQPATLLLPLPCGTSTAALFLFCGTSTPAGHARVYVAFDVIYRFLRHLGYDVRGSVWLCLACCCGLQRLPLCCCCGLRQLLPLLLLLLLAPAAGWVGCKNANWPVWLLLQVNYVRNFTDVDDKIIARAAAVGEDPLALAQRFIHEFHADMVGCLGRRAW